MIALLLTRAQVSAKNSKTGCVKKAPCRSLDNILANNQDTSALSNLCRTAAAS